jgi:DNA-binding response OmpR family regulator
MTVTLCRTITVGDLSYDPDAGRLYKYGHPITLSPAPLRLLAFFMEHAERSFVMDDLIQRFYGRQVEPDERTRAVIRSQVRWIRLAIEDGTGPWLTSERQGPRYGLWTQPPVARAAHLAGRLN